MASESGKYREMTRPSERARAWSSGAGIIATSAHSRPNDIAHRAVSFHHGSAFVPLPSTSLSQPSNVASATWARFTTDCGGFSSPSFPPP